MKNKDSRLQQGASGQRAVDLAFRSQLCSFKRVNSLHSASLYKALDVRSTTRVVRFHKALRLFTVRALNSTWKKPRKHILVRSSKEGVGSSQGEGPAQAAWWLFLLWAVIYTHFKDKLAFPFSKIIFGKSPLNIPYLLSLWKWIMFHFAEVQKRLLNFYNH